MNIRKTIAIAVIAAGLCAVGYGVNKEFFPEKAKNMQELETIIKEETSKIRDRQDKRTVYWTFGRVPWRTAASCKFNDNEYMVILDKDLNRTAIRHELYHIFRAHCDKAYEKGEWTTLDKIKNEITARLYADYGIRL